MPKCVACGDEINWIAVWKSSAPHGLLLCEVGLAHTCQNLLQDQELLSCQFVPIWSLTSYTQSYMESNLFAHTVYCTLLSHTHIQITTVFSTVVHTIYIYRAGRQMCCLSASRAHAKAACLGWVWLKSGLGNPLSRLLHAVMLMKLLLQ